MVARTYRATIRYSELAEEVQEKTGVRTRMLMHYWIGEVLGRVSHDCRAKGEPLLSALCVDAGGSVGPCYGALIAELEGMAPSDADDHAAEERLYCYRHFGATLPPDGGRPALTPQMLARRRRERRTGGGPRPPRMCPNCHLALPAKGICDLCS
ncbi:MAG: hypothetical protein ACP5PW_06385 [Candidatus Dormibacteria bacterium]